mmetsp:Transcript_136462/g.272161  ORF Transcript_136462/g.272161 Transcript_136462/m.272161 type:complete len:111 (-) Transcript_136462:685-1017(-)
MTQRTERCEKVGDKIDGTHIAAAEEQYHCRTRACDNLDRACVSLEDCCQHAGSSLAPHLREGTPSPTPTGFQEKLPICCLYMSMMRVGGFVISMVCFTISPDQESNSYRE